MTLNLLIPAYNNYQNVIDTIMSFNCYNSKHNIQILIIDDCSTENNNYAAIQELFKPFYKIDICKTPYNMGPGNARQYGLELIKTDYIMFIDAGDIVYSPTDLIEYLNFIEQNPQTLMFSPAHLEQREDNAYNTYGPENNRIHGKIYKTSFLKKYNISFCPEGSYSNEDIGFNIACKAYCNYLQNLNPNIQYCIEYDAPIVIWTFDKNSLTRKDNYSFYYKSNMGIGINAVYAIKSVLNNGIALDFLQRDICIILVNSYIFYISALNEREDCVKDAFNGALYFYKNILIPYSVNKNMLLEQYNYSVGTFLLKQNDPFCKKLPTISFLEFLSMLDKAYLNEKESEEK